MGLKNKTQCLALLPLLSFVTMEMFNLCKLFLKVQHSSKPYNVKAAKMHTVGVSSGRNSVNHLGNVVSAKTLTSKQHSLMGSHCPFVHAAGYL